MRTTVPTLGALTAAHPDWQFEARLPDTLTAAQVAVWTQRHLVTVRNAARSGQLRATQFDSGGCYRIAKSDAQRWKDGLAPLPRRHLHRA